MPVTPPGIRYRPPLGITASVLSAAMLLLAAPLIAPGAAAQAPAVTAAALRQQGERLRREQRLPQALAAYRALVELEPGNFEDRFWLAKLLGWTGRHEAADSAFVQLLEERPGDYDSQIGLADVRLWRGETAGARTVLDDLRRTHPEDPEVLHRLDALRRLASRIRWEADLEYYGERLSRQPATNGATLSLRARPSGRLRWHSAVTLQEKFEQTESRFGGGLAYRPLAHTEIEGSAFLAPGAEVLPRQTYGVGLGQRVAPRLILGADYGFLDFQDADVHQAGPRLELYAGRHWLVAARYRYSSTRFTGVEGAVGDHAGSLTLGYLYGEGNLLRVFAAAGGESFTQPSRELIGEFSAHALGAAWRHFPTPRLGLEIGYARQDRSDGGDQDSYSLRLVQRW